MGLQSRFERRHFGSFKRDIFQNTLKVILLLSVLDLFGELDLKSRLNTLLREKILPTFLYLITLSIKSFIKRDGRKDVRKASIIPQDTVKPRVNVTIVLRAAFVPVDPKSVKRC